MPDRPLNVLLAEDDPAQARLIDVLLSDATLMKFKLERAASLAACIARLGQGSVDAVLLDLNLGDSVGLRTLTEVQSVAPTVPVVVLTGFGDEQLALDAVRQGAQDYLVKDEIETNLLARSLLYAVERKRADQSVHESEARLRLITDQLPAILWTTDRDLRFMSSRGRELESLGLKPDQVLGLSVFDFFHTGEPELPAANMHRRALQGEEVSADVDWEGRRFHSHVEPLRGASGQIIGTIGIALDITDQYQMQQGLAAAQRIQQHLLPKEAPKSSVFDIAGACYPAEQCSGDYFDYIAMPDGQIAIVLADAAGHGFGPAILAATVRSYLRAAALERKGVHEMLTTANWQLVFDSAPDQYVTMFCCQLDPKSRSFTYAAAGHQGFLIDRKQKVKTLSSTCMPLGIDETEIFPLSRCTALRPGDILLFVTDGVLEARSPDDQEFGLDRTLRVVEAQRNESARKTVDAIYQAVRGFCAPKPQKDDITAVVVKMPPPTADDTW